MCVLICVCMSMYMCICACVRLCVCVCTCMHMCVLGHSVTISLPSRSTGHTYAPVPHPPCVWSRWVLRANLQPRAPAGLFSLFTTVSANHGAVTLRPPVCKAHGGLNTGVCVITVPPGQPCPLHCLLTLEESTYGLRAGSTESLELGGAQDLPGLGG